MLETAAQKKSLLGGSGFSVNPGNKTNGAVIAPPTFRIGAGCFDALIGLILIRGQRPF
jgi:hypothetical protein